MADNIRIVMPVTVNVASARRQLDAFISLYERRGISLATNISSVNNQLREQGTILGSNGQVLSGNLNRTNEAMVQQGRIAQNTSRQVNGLASSMRTMTRENERSAQSAISVLGKIAMWTALTTVVFTPIKISKDMINTIYEIDTAIVDLKKVSDELGESVGIKQFTKDINEMAKAVGHSTTAAIASITDFKRLGYSLKEAQILGEQALVYSNIGDLDIGDATQSIISTLAGFQLGVENVNHVMDAYNEVGNNFSSTSAGIGKALQRSSSALFEANNTLEESIGLIVAGNASVQNIEKVGNGLKTVSMRIRGISEETGEAIPQLDGLVKKLTGVDMMKDENTFKSTYDIMVEISKVWKDLKDIDRAELLDKLFGKHQGAVGASILNNMSMGIKAMETATNSLGSSAKEQAEYMDGLQAKVNTFKESATNLYIDTVSPETLKSIVDFGTKTIDLVDKIGLLNLSIIGLYLTLSTTGKITAFTTAIKTSIAVFATYTLGIQTASVYTVAAATTMTTQMRIVRVASLALTTTLRGLKVALSTLWPLALIEGAILIYRHFKKIKEQIEEVKQAQSGFNVILKDFQNSLNIAKINEMATALENLKQSVDYDASVEKIKKLEGEIATINPSSLVATMKSKEIERLTALIKPYEDAQNKFNESQKLATSLDYESVQAGNQKIAVKIKENEANRQLINNYQKIHDKLAEGNELTKEESDLNQKMIDKYPQYTKVLNDKTSAIGINIEALKANQTAEEALATISFNAMKTKAEASSKETDIIIANTEARIHAIQAEIDAITKSSTALQFHKLLEQDYVTTMTEFKNGTILEDTLTPRLQIDLGNANKQLQMAKQTKTAWNTLANMSMDDLKKSVYESDSNSASSSSGSSSKDQTKSLEDLTTATLAQIKVESDLQKIKSKTIQKELEQAKSENNYKLALTKTNELIASQAKELSLLQSAREKVNELKDSALSSSQFGDISRWFTGNSNEESTTYISERNKIIGQINQTTINGETKKAEALEKTLSAMDSEFKSMQLLRNGWVSYTDAITTATEESKKFAKTSKEDLSTIVENQIKKIQDEVKKISDDEVSKLDTNYKNLNITQWIEDNISATDNWASAQQKLSAEIAKIGSPNTIEGQKKFNSLMEQSAKATWDALQAEKAWQKELEKVRNQALYDSMDASLQQFTDQIENIDTEINLLKDGRSSLTTDLDYSIVPIIDYDTAEEAVAKAIAEKKGNTFEFTPPYSFVEFMNDDFTNSLTTVTNNIDDLKQKINDLNVTPENKEQILGYYREIQTQIEILSNVAKDAQANLEIKLKEGVISQEEFDLKMQQIQLADLTVLAVPRIELTAETLTSIEEFKTKIGALPVDIDTKNADAKLVELTEEDYRALLTINFEATAVEMELIKLQMPTSSIHTVYVQTVSSPVVSRARGTNGIKKDELAIVDDEGNGKREIIVTPDGKMLLGDNSGAKLVSLKKGSRVIPNKETEEILKKQGIPAYAGGSWSDVVVDTNRKSDFSTYGSVSSEAWKLWNTDPIWSVIYKKISDAWKQNDFSMGKVGVAAFDLAKSMNTLTFSTEDVVRINNVLAGNVDNAVQEQKQDSSSTDSGSTETNTDSSSTANNSETVSLITEKISLWQSLTNKATENIRTLKQSIEQYKKVDANGNITYEDNETTREVAEQINAQLSAQKTAQEAIKALEKERFEAQYGSYDKAQEAFDTQISYNQKVLEYQQLIGSSVEDQIKTEQEILETQNDKLASLEDEYTELDKIVSAVDADKTSQAWILANDKLIEVNSSILDMKIGIEETGQAIENIKFDNLTKAFDDIQSGLETTLSYFDKLIALYKLQGKSQEEISKLVKQSIQDQQAKLASEEAELKVLEANLDVIDKTADPDKWNKAKAAVDAQKSAILDTKTAITQAYSDIADTIIDAYKSAYKEQEEIELASIDKQKKVFDKFIQDKIDALSDASSTQDYTEDLTKAQKEERETQAKLDALSLDNSIEGKAKKLELAKQLAEQQAAIAKTMRHHDTELQTEELQRQKTNNDDAVEQQKETTTNYYEGLINDEQHWADVRQQIYAGNFANIQTEFDKFNIYFNGKNKESCDYIGKNYQDILNIIKQVNTASNSMSGLPATAIPDATPELTRSFNDPEPTAKDDSWKPDNWDSMDTWDKGAWLSSNSTVDEIKKDKEKLQVIIDFVNEHISALKQQNISEATKTNTIAWLNGLNEMYGTSFKFASGGETETTGWHWLDGKKGKPEGVLSAEQNASWKQLVNNLPSITDVLDKFMNNNPLQNIMCGFKTPDFSSVRIPNAQQNMEFKFDNLITVQGDVSKDSLPGLKEIAKYTIQELNKSFNRNGILRGV